MTYTGTHGTLARIHTVMFEALRLVASWLTSEVLESLRVVERQVAICPRQLVRGSGGDDRVGVAIHLSEACNMSGVE
jgi:hypothetical protein